MEHRLDPLGDLDVKRVLAFARAREQYPSVPRGLLLDYCQAAWQAAVAGGATADVIERFERALMLIAWTHRCSPHLTFRSLVDQVIPQVALKPFMAPADAAPVEEPEPAEVVELEPAAKRDAVRPPARRLIPRVPFASPIPLGAAVAAGFIGVTMLGQTGALPVAPFAPAGNDDAKAPDDDGAPAAPRHAAASSSPAPAVDQGPALVGLAQLPDPPAAEPTAAPAPKRAAPKPAKVVAATPAPPPAAPAPAPVAPTPPAVVEAPAPVPDAPAAPDEAGQWVADEIDAVDTPAAPTEEPAAPVDLQDGQGNEENGATREDFGRHGDRGEHAAGRDHFEPIDLSKAEPPQNPAEAPPAPEAPEPAATQPGGEPQQPDAGNQGATAPAAPTAPQQLAPPAAPQPPPAPAQVGPPPAPQT